MATQIKKITPRKKILLEDDGIVSREIQAIVHEAPSQVHYDRAAEAVSMDRENVPHCASVAELLAFVLSVKAVGGQDTAIKEVLDRFAPKAARNTTAVDVNVGAASAPMASTNTEEQSAAQAYMDRLKAASNQ